MRKITFVNDRKLSEVGWSALSLSSDEFKTASSEYLRALEESKRKERTEYLAAIQGVNILTDSIKSTAEVFKKDLPYLYQIVPKTKIWIDLQVDKKGEYVK
ncbi:hypothetical protein LS70_000090 [Helicobacter sp. MIT 11-5569]|uniref:hypothetical protein n=1 Tax=Helicobacter sp. MIT 11-5569 TaxID=1548151 RepID=UPI000AEA8E4E|nr:hypothetical protein [Helicobacter sp. MIT 11-5569]TLD85003.1 hypothetical protein LS70_000090 [Helicobacter sp. MIT 11-5569]